MTAMGEKINESNAQILSGALRFNQYFWHRQQTKKHNFLLLWHFYLRANMFTGVFPSAHGEHLGLRCQPCRHGRDCRFCYLKQRNVSAL
jgi:hypothetical protein